MKSASGMVWASLFAPSLLFLKHVLILIYAEFPILQKGCHNIVNIVTLNYVNECCHNVVEMFSYNVLRQHCGNILEMFLEYVAAT